MAKKITGYIKLQVPAGQANPSPPIGPALGQRGVNIPEFCKQFNAATQKLEAGLADPDRDHRLCRPLLHLRDAHAAGVVSVEEGGQDRQGIERAGPRPAPARVTQAQLREIAEVKMKDLNANSVEQAMKIIDGSARSMGLEVQELSHEQTRQEISRPRPRRSIARSSTRSKRR